MGLASIVTFKASMWKWGDILSTSSFDNNQKAAAHKHANFSGHGCSMRIPNQRSLPFLYSSAGMTMNMKMMVDGNSSSSSGKDFRPIITPFPPSMWGDTFSTFSFDHKVQQKYSEEIEALKKEVRMILMASTSTKLLRLIDNLDRLGLAYHFEIEIEHKLKQVYASLVEEAVSDSDLFTTALRFRLLRNHRYHVSSNEFVKFVDKDNKFRETLSSDVEGLLSLHEAAHIRIPNENILEEAVAFTRHHLTRMMPQLESPSREEVQQALKYPLHRNLPILTLPFQIHNYEINDESRDELVLRLAKLNFNFMQNIYRNEISEVARWWNPMKLASKLPYFRDRLVECYIWALAYHFEPQYSSLRVIMHKLLMLATVMDDTYDNYATLEEIELFTQALQRWNMEEIDELPDYLKLVYECVMKFSAELKGEAEKNGKGYMVPLYIDEMKRAALAFAQEQKWIREQNNLPTFEEYMSHTEITGLMYVISTVAMAMNTTPTKGTLDCLQSDSDVFHYTSYTGRLLGDLATYKRESKGGTMLTPMDYFMKEKGVATMDEAESKMRELIEEKWKKLSAAWVNSSMVPAEVVVQFLNFARSCTTHYAEGEDSFTNPHKNLAPLIVALLLEPVLV